MLQWGKLNNFQTIICQAKLIIFLSEKKYSNNKLSLFNEKMKFDMYFKGFTCKIKFDCRGAGSTLILKMLLAAERKICVIVAGW